MSRVVVFGASGYTGGLLSDVLAARGRAFVAAGRDAERVRARVGGLATVEDVVEADVTDPASLEAMLRGADVVVSTVGPFTELGRPVLRAAVRTGTAYADSTGELAFVRWAHDELGDEAVRAGVTAVPASAYDFLPGDLLAALAAAALERPREAHVTYLVRARGPLPGAVSSGTRASIAAGLGEASLALVDGGLVEEGLAEQRRLAWFPKPIGPHHAASFPGSEPLTVPRHVPSVTTVRTYLAIPTVVAELAQATGLLAARSGRAREGLARVLRASDRDPAPSKRASVRWACVVEALDEDGTVVRAWANGRDVYAFSAHSLAVVAEALADGSTPGGVVAPAEVLDPAATLDELADVAGVRWSVKRPATRRPQRG